MARIFISHRTEDTGDLAGRLAEKLGRFEFEAVLLNRETIPLGANFADAIRDELGTLEAALVLIGTEWLVGKDGRRRLDDETDWVRREVVHALDSGAPVISVYVGGATALKPEDLPEPMRRLTTYQGYRFDPDYFARDANELGKRIENTLIAAARARAGEDGRTVRDRFRRQLQMIIGFLFVVTFGVAFLQGRVSELPSALWTFPALMDFAAFAWWLYAGAATPGRLA